MIGLSKYHQPKKKNNGKSTLDRWYSQLFELSCNSKIFSNPYQRQFAQIQAITLHQPSILPGIFTNFHCGNPIFSRAWFKTLSSWKDSVTSWASAIWPQVFWLWNDGEIIGHGTLMVRHAGNMMGWWSKKHDNLRGVLRIALNQGFESLEKFWIRRNGHITDLVGCFGL